MCYIGAMKNLMRIYTCWFLIIAFSAAGFTTSLGDVLCIGEDGHVEIEYANSPCCNKPVASLIMPTESSLLQESGRIDDCMDCSDIPLRALSHLKRPTIFKIPILHKYQFEFSPNLVCLNTFIENPSDSQNRHINNSIERSPPGNSFLIISPILIC